jgi:preprotein translocase subunit YajC
VFISEAWAQAASTTSAAPATPDIGTTFIFVVMFIMLYFLMVRPQQKRAKQHRAMLDGLQKGDEVITAGGVLGKVSKLTDGYVTLEIANNTEINVQKIAITLLLPKGTIKSI